MKLYRLDGTVVETNDYISSSIAMGVQKPTRRVPHTSPTWARTGLVDGCAFEVRFVDWIQDSNSPELWHAVLEQADPYTVSRAREDMLMEGRRK